jgi:hypothetical protein
LLVTPRISVSGRVARNPAAKYKAGGKPAGAPDVC